MYKGGFVQNRAVRCFLQVHRYAPIAAMESEMGWYPPEIEFKKNMIRLWNRYIVMENSRLVKQIFLADLNENDNWCTQMFSLLNELNLGHNFVSRSTINLDHAENLLKENYVRKWRRTVVNKAKLRTYVKIKVLFETESYVKYCLNRKKRSLLAQFRIGILPLRIETGRFSNLQTDQRICYMCKENCNEDVVEDEMHFILDCHMFARERLELESIISNSSTELNEGSREYKFKTITDVWKEFSIYLIKCWEKRQDFIYDSMRK